MIIYTNENNPAALKLIIAKNCAEENADVRVVAPDDKCLSDPKHLPYLEIDKSLDIFIPNAAICYLFPPHDDVSSRVSELLEFESTVLSPNLAYVLGSSLKNDKVRDILISALQKLNNILEKKNFLAGDNLSAADISVWSILYCLYICPKLKNEYLANFHNISIWIEKLEKEQHFKGAISSFKVVAGQPAYQALLIGAKYVLPSSTGKNTDLPSPTRESPKHDLEVLTNEELQAAEKAFDQSLTDVPQLKKQDKVVLPVPGQKNVFITSALPYVNNVPHLGNIIGCVLSADVFARFSRLCNNNTLYICGTDEYGTATETKALEEGLTCQAICDKYYKIHKEIYEWFNISFDHFGRTSTPQQEELCQNLFLQLNHNGFMFTQAVEQLFCEKCQRYLADRFVEGGCPNIGCTYEDARGDQCDGCGKLVNAVELKNPKCKICKNSPVLKTSSQFFIDLPKLEPLLRHWMKLSSPGWSHNADVIAKAWLKEGLKPRCITRDLKWGVPVPLEGFKDKVFYVWFDAPIGYMSITKAYTKDYEKWWKSSKDTNVVLYQFMAKDNVPFHSVLFPGMLLGANKGYVTVSHIMATEYLNYEDGKFSKSRGVGVFGTDARDTGIPSDVWRFYLLYVRPESQDSSFSWSDLATKNNSELLNNLGNFVNRALVFAKNNFNSTVPTLKLNKDDITLLALCTRELKGYIAALEKAKLRDGIRHILSISRHGNQYMQSNQPWVLLKGNAEEKIRAGTVIGISCNLACLLALLLEPYMPITSASLKKQLNVSNIALDPDNIRIPVFLPTGHVLGEPSPLFAKIEPTLVEDLKKKYAGTQEENTKKNVSSNNVDIKSIEAEVAKQADKVRLLKSSGADKQKWQPEVTILLSLKSKLEAALKASKTASKTPSQDGDKIVANGEVDQEQVKKLEEEIAKQGLVVRKLKESGAAKSVWQPEVDKLLSLKSQLASASGAPPTATQKSKKGKK